MSAMLNRVSGSFRLPNSARRPKRVHVTMPTDFDAAVKKRAAYGSKSLDRFERMLLSLPSRDIDEENTELPWPDKYLQAQGSEEFSKHVMDMQWRIIYILTREYYGRLPSPKTIHFGVNNHPIGGPLTMLADPEEEWLVWETFRPRYEKREAELAAQRAKAAAEKAERERKEALLKSTLQEIEEAREAKQARTLGTAPGKDEITKVEDAPLAEEEDELTRELTSEEEAWLWEHRRALLHMHSKEAGLRSAYRGASLPVIPETETEPPEIPVIYRDQEDVPVGELAGGRKRGKRVSADGEGKTVTRGGISKRLSRIFRKRTE